MVAAYLLAIVIILLTVYKIKKRKYEECERTVPGPKALPLIGHIHLFWHISNAGDIMQVVYDHLDMKNGIIRVWLGQFFAVGVWDAKFVEIVANNPNSMDKGPILSVLRDTMNGVFALDACDSLWKDLRRPLVKNMTKKLIEKEYFSVFTKHSFRFVEYLKEQKCNKEINILIPVSSLLLDVFSETHYGVSTNEVRENKFNFLENFDIFMELSVWGFAKFNIFWKLFAAFTKFGKERRKASKNVLKFHEWVLEERKKVVKRGEGYREMYSDFIMRYVDEKNMPKIEALRQLMDSTIGGTDTSSVITSSALLFLAMHPAIQEEVYQEQFEIFGHSSREPTVEEIESMECLTRVVKETIRIISPPFLFKACNGDITMGEYNIPKGAIILLCVQILHKNPNYWKEPNNFYPNHFLPEEVAKRPRFGYVPYGCGPRICPGYRYGVMVVKNILSTLIRNFKFTTTMKFEDIIFDFRILMQVNSGYNMTIQERVKN